MHSQTRFKLRKALPVLAVPTLLAIAGCGGRVSASGIEKTIGLEVHASANQIDTNGKTRYSATLPDGQTARVQWSVAGGDAQGGAGTITQDGVYTPPAFLTEDEVSVAVTALAEGATQDRTGFSDLTVTPGFLQPLTPGNLALAPGGTATVSASISEVGGNGSIHFALTSNPNSTAAEEQSSLLGTLGAPRCVRGEVSGPNPAYTVCSATYTAPAQSPAAGSVFIVGSIGSGQTSGGGTSKPASWTRVLLNSSGISSNPAAHQAHLAVPVPLGSSSGNNADYDAAQGQLSDCCGGTLGALLQDASGTQFVLSNNHVLARSDQSLPDETVIQPGLIDNGCTPYGVGPGTTPVATLTGYPALSSPATNVDAAIARVTAGAVDPKGNILELGARQTDGTLSSAPPGTSSSGGKGEAAALGMMVAKSGRTTGLTCAAVSAVSLDVMVDYFTDCAETAHALTKTFTNQIAIAGASFSDAGDSGALVVDTANAEPVGLFFAGGTDSNGIEHAIANPASDVLTALDGQVPTSNGPTSYSFVGTQDHPVSCLSYGGKASDEPAKTSALSAVETERVEAALPLAQFLLNPSTGVARLGVVGSKDRPSYGAIGLYLDGSLGTLKTVIPASIGGIPTVVLPAVAESSAMPKESLLNKAIAVKQKNSTSLFRSNPAIFGVGVGQSLDNPGDAALVLFVDRNKIDRNKIAGQLPVSVDGQRVRVLLMDRLHVTRAHGPAARKASTCVSTQSRDFFADRLQLPD